MQSIRIHDQINIILSEAVAEYIWFYTHTRKSFAIYTRSHFNQCKTDSSKVSIDKEIKQDTNEAIPLSSPQLLFISFSFDDTPFTAVYFVKTSRPIH